MSAFLVCSLFPLPCSLSQLGNLFGKTTYQFILAVLLLILMTACSTPTPPTEIAPSGDIVQRAIALQIEQTQAQLSQKLKAAAPQLEISQIQVQKLEPIVVSQLPTYHLQGTYNLFLTFSKQKVNQKKNYFDIYLQRQAEGKTWRLLKRESETGKEQYQWKSYLIPSKI